MEITSLNEEDLNFENVEEKAYQSSPSKKELKNDVQKSPIKKSNSKSDLYSKTIDETLENYETPEKQNDEERKARNKQEIARGLDYEEQEDDQKSKTKPLEFRFLNLLKNQIKLDKEVEI